MPVRLLRANSLRNSWAPQHEQAATRQTESASASGYGPPATATSWKAGRFTGADFPLQPDGTLRCPAGQMLKANERRREADGTLRVVYGASIHSCRPCLLREQCQWNGGATKKPRQVSVLLHPLAVGPAPLLWRDWNRKVHRHACRDLLRTQRVEVEVQPGDATFTVPPAPLSRAERAHARLTWTARLARNSRAHAASRVTIHLFGVEAWFATSLGLVSA